MEHRPLPRRAPRPPDDEIDRRIGLNIRYIRLHRGYSQEILAKRCGVTAMTVYNWEKGRVTISAPTIVNLCVSLDCKVGELFLGVTGNRYTRIVPAIKEMATFKYESTLSRIPDRNARDALMYLAKKIAKYTGASAEPPAQAEPQTETIEQIEDGAR